ncbi:orotidine 5'-phosphate decarboxylase [Candidatus Kaiserbacteria bacterium]|nr:orotidine 5'-phosphate decarboxylase [Candidatus Kaiserbacteria bacterium]
MSGDRIFVAYDWPFFGPVQMRTLEQLMPHVGGIKFDMTTKCAEKYSDGHITTVCTEAREFSRRIGFKRIFADEKLKGNPDAVAKAVRSIASTGAWGFTFHADMPSKSIEAVVKSRGESLACGVTILTSYSEVDCYQLYGRTRKDMTCYLAAKLRDAKANALTCSPRWLLALAEAGHIGYDKLITITPSVRLENDPRHDHDDTMLVADAVRAGADYLVIGRPIMDSPDPVAAAQRYGEAIATARSNRSMV